MVAVHVCEEDGLDVRYIEPHLAQSHLHPLRTVEHEEFFPYIDHLCGVEVSWRGQGGPASYYVYFKFFHLSDLLLSFILVCAF